jgi:hypothetical protein
MPRHPNQYETVHATAMVRCVAVQYCSFRLLGRGPLTTAVDFWGMRLVLQRAVASRKVWWQV